MIRINLLSEGRRPVVARKKKATDLFGSTEPALLFLGGGLLLGFLIAAGWWWLANSELKKVEGEVREAKAEVERLKPILEEVADFEAKKEELTRKIEVIKNLTRAQKGPVALMDAVSRSLPDQVWLESMEVRAATVQLRGKAFTTNGVASFIENLNAVPEFGEPDPQSVARAGEVFDFSINFDFQYLDPEALADDEGDGALEAEEDVAAAS
ncbi:MAG: PilN domain-containing protein [Acidobacteriota bacterium]